MGRTVRGISHGVALPDYILELTQRERRNARERWNAERRRAGQTYTCRRCKEPLPYAAFPQLRVFERDRAHESHRRGVICTACLAPQTNVYPPPWERLPDDERQQAEAVRAWVAGEWGEEPAWLDAHGRGCHEAREGRITVAAILDGCYGWGPRHAGYAIGCDHSTVIHHLGKLADGLYPDVDEMVAEYRREHRRSRKAG